MAVKVVYSSIEGHTTKIAKFVMSCVHRTGQYVSMNEVDLANTSFTFHGIQKVILAAPIHRMRHPIEFEKFVKYYCEDLLERETLLMSVSLCAGFPEGIQEARSYVEDLSSRTGFVPTRDLLVGGALQYEKYCEDEAWIVRYIALGMKRHRDVAKDLDLTDWVAIKKVVSEFVTKDSHL